MLMAKRKRKSLYGSNSSKKQRTTYSSPAISMPSVVTPRSGLGTRKLVKMIYFEKGINLTTPAVGGATDYIFRLNSVFDPNSTGTGHQPLLHDQMAQVFERYCVIGCGYKVTFSNSSTSNRNVVGVYISDRVDTSSDFTLLIEQGSAQYKSLAVADSGQSIATFSGYVDLPKLMGQTKDAYIASSNYAVEFGVDPGDPGYLHCVAADISAGGGTVTTLAVELQMDVLCLGTKLIPQS